ncbi:hypothetical protein [Streptomyces sp. NBC_00158]|uniref:hypothetical protein n=1 Tax=Streptomyces sp. NBC_00158 TaxID=2903627 RepID=UPI0032482EE4
MLAAALPTAGASQEELPRLRTLAGQYPCRALHLLDQTLSQLGSASRPRAMIGV